MEATPENWRIADIKVGHRYRKSLGDLKELIESIGLLGVLEPVLVTPTGLLIAGQRRLEACKAMGRTEIPVRVLPELDELLLDAELAENVVRKDMTLEEKMALGRALEPVIAARAQARQRAGVKQPSGQFPEGSRGRHDLNATRDVVGRTLGMSGRTYARAKDVLKAAENQPETFKALADEMLETGKVHGAHNKLAATRSLPVKSRQATEERRERIREMAREGYQVVAIAGEMGVGRGVVTKVIHDAGLQTVRDRIGFTKRLDVNRVMGLVVAAAEPDELAMRTIYANWEALDHARDEEWATALTNAIKTLTGLRNALRR